MKLFISTIASCLLSITVVATNRIEERQGQVSSAISASASASLTPSSTTSVFSIPVPTTAQTVNGTDHDLSKHFCRIWRHQSVLADGKIYIDGGNIYIPDNSTTFDTMAVGQFEQGMNDVLLVLDLSANFTNQETAPYSVIDKGLNVPNALIEGVLWYSKITRKIYQLGGWFSFNSVQDPGYIKDPVPESSIWEFDIDLKTWALSALSYVNVGSKLDRPGAAANCDAPSLNKNFVFEGYVQRRSDYDYSNYTVSSEFKFLEGMLQLDTNTSPPTLTNISVPDYVGPRMNGAMVHVPIGDQGIVVQIAGQTTMNPTPFGQPIVNANAGNVNINNSFVDIYDIETGYWFRQATFGVPEIPSSRSDICTILVTALDNSSYNIFMIAGVQTYNSVIAYEDMWVLTMPTFQWVKVHTRPGGIYGHTCHAIGENLVVIGGMQTTSSGGNVNNCSSHMPAEIFSLATMEYTGVYDFAGASRSAPVPQDIYNLIGGTASGGAVVTKPTLWSDLYLQYVFDPKLPRPQYTPTYTLANTTSSSTNTTSTSTPTPVPATSHTGAIAGGVVGGIVVPALLITLIIILLKRRKARKNSPAVDPALPPPPMVTSAELPGYEYKDPHAVEAVSPGTPTPLHFEPYKPMTHVAREPQEMDAAAAEAQDEWRPLQGSGPVSPGQGMHSPSRFSEVSVDSLGSTSPVGIGESPTLGPSRVARKSVMSEVSRDSN